MIASTVRVEVVPLRLGEEADVPEVDAEQRRDGLARELGSPQDRPVAADDQGDLASGARRRSPGATTVGPPDPAIGSCGASSSSSADRRCRRPSAASPRPSPPRRPPDGPVCVTSSTVRRGGVLGGRVHATKPLTSDPPATTVRTVSWSTGSAPRAEPDEVLDVARRARAAGSRTHSPRRVRARRAARGHRRRRPRPAAPARAPRRPCRAVPCRPRTAA